LVVLQPLGLGQLPEPLQARTRVIRQAAPQLGELAPAPAQPGFLVCALSHLRDVKDPLLAARTVALLPETSAIRIVHLGDATDETWRTRARDAERATGGRWTWLGGRRRADALRVLAGARLLVLTSRSEGGANVVTEAIALGVPVLSTRVDGSLGILGDDYPGYCEVGDAAGLAALLARCEAEPGFLGELRARVMALRPLVDPLRERASWRALIEELVAG
jgi:glycosyltransferase involved in cell wall biosynthesis